ncbi:MAG: hypothetical protein U0V74_15825 [Chitinophagales bacterium]
MKAKRILFKAYWGNRGWKENEDRGMDRDDFEYAKSKGLMFDHLNITRESLLEKLTTLVQQTEKKKLSDAFLGSLSNRKVHWRSALASYANSVRILAAPELNQAYLGYGINIDLNILNFERLKWGGVRHFIGVYNYLDLLLFKNEQIPEPTENDKGLMKTLLETIDNAEGDCTPARLRAKLKDIIPGSKQELHLLIEIMACAEILKANTPGRPLTGKADWFFAIDWRGEDKYNRAALQNYFGGYGLQF